MRSNSMNHVSGPTSSKKQATETWRGIKGTEKSRMYRGERYLVYGSLKLEEWV